MTTQTAADATSLPRKTLPIQKRIRALPLVPLIGLSACLALYDFCSYSLPYQAATAATFIHALIVVGLALVNIRWGLGFFLVSLIFADEISRYALMSDGDTWVVNMMTVSLGGIALVNVLAFALFGIAALLVGLRWSRTPKRSEFCRTDLFVVLIVALYAAATLHSMGRLAANFRLYVNHINLPIMICGFYAVVRLFVLNRSHFLQLWQLLILSLSAKIIWWTGLALLGIGSPFGTTLRVGFGSVWTLFVLLFVYGLLLQQRGLGVSRRGRLLLLLCTVLSGGLLLISAGRMLWLLTGLCALIAFLLSEISTKVRFLLLGCACALIVLLGIAWLRPGMFETINAMATTLRVWENHNLEASHSTMARVYEFKNIHAQLVDHGNLILGDGPGSTFSDRYHPFPFGLGAGDYSLAERESREFRNSHSLITQLMVQLGYGGMLCYLGCIAGIYASCWRVYRRTGDAFLRVITLCLLAFLPAMVYMAWNSKANMLLGILLGIAGALYSLELVKNGAAQDAAASPVP